jgi:tRNA/rRNA methyltransferase
LLLKKELPALDGSALEAKNASIPEPVAAQRRGFLFGSERFGMANEDVYRCHVALSIPTNPQFGSLNLGAAIQVIAYEWRQALGGFGVEQATPGACADAAGGGHAGALGAGAGAIGFWTRRRPRSSCRG